MGVFGISAAVCGVQGEMEGVKQQAEQHLTAVHSEARSMIQKAQALAADLQVPPHLGCACHCVCA